MSPHHPAAPDTLLYLSAADVRSACEEVDPLACIRRVLLLHSAGEVELPAEAYLSWAVAGGGRARSLALPGWLGGDVQAAGTKLINANPDNPGRGIPRASGLTVLFEPETARLACVMEGAHLSGLRTAALSTLVAQHLCVATGSVGILGAGALTEQHVQLLAARLDGVGEMRVFDLDPRRAASLARRLAPEVAPFGVRLVAVGSANAAVAGADLVVTCTTTTTSYVPYSWLLPGCVVVNVSLDDLEEEVFRRADRLYVDDWSLVVADEHRLLGRLARAGRVSGPGEPAGRGAAVTGTLGDLLAGACPGRGGPDDIIVVNPFGMALHDVALAHEVCLIATRRGLGLRLPR